MSEYRKLNEEQVIANNEGVEALFARLYEEDKNLSPEQKLAREIHVKIETAKEIVQVLQMAELPAEVSEDLDFLEESDEVEKGISRCLACNLSTSEELAELNTVIKKFFEFIKKHHLIYSVDKDTTDPTDVSKVERAKFIFTLEKNI